MFSYFYYIVCPVKIDIFYKHVFQYIQLKAKLAVCLKGNRLVQT